MAHRAGLIEPWLVGDEAAIKTTAGKIGWDIGDFPLVAARDETESATRAVALARTGEVAVLMKGGVHTDALMRAVVNRDNGPRTDRRMGHVFRTTFPGPGQRFICIWPYPDHEKF